MAGLAYWHRQGEEALFADLLWDKPENKQQAGKLLIIGGNAHSFAAPATAYQASQQAGIGVTKVLLPQALQKIVGSVIEDGEYAPSNKSGSFARIALSEWLDFGAWADGVLLAGDFGRNSETAIVLEQFVARYPSQITITHDGLDYFLANPDKLLANQNAICVASFGQLQKLATGARLTQAFTYSMTINQIAEMLHLFTSIHAASIVLQHNGIYFVARDGEVITTKLSKEDPIWRIKTAATCSVWALQHPTKTLAALATAVLELSQ